MSVQEMKQRIHHLMDELDDETALGQLLDAANEVVSASEDQRATVDDLTDDQRDRLNKAIQQHRDGKTVSNEAMKHRWMGAGCCSQPERVSRATICSPSTSGRLSWPIRF